MRDATQADAGGRRKGKKRVQDANRLKTSKPDVSPRCRVCFSCVGKMNACYISDEKSFFYSSVLDGQESSRLNFTLNTGVLKARELVQPVLESARIKALVLSKPHIFMSKKHF